MNETHLTQADQVAINSVLPQLIDKDVDFKELFESLSVMFYVQDFKPIKRISYVSPAFKSLGYPLERWYENSEKSMFNQITHPDDDRMIDEENSKIQNWDVEETDYEYRVYTRSGEMRWWKDHSKAILDENGEKFKWVGVIHDITDRKIAEQEAKESKQKLLYSAAEIASANDLVEDIIGSIADMLIVVDDDGVIERVNQTTLDKVGYESAEMIGKPLKFLTQKEVFLTEDEYEDLLRLKKLIDLEKDVITKDGRVIKTLISASILHGRKTAGVIVAKDITQRIEDENRLRQYAKKLERTNGELQDFAYVASHDLQEPLRKIQAFGDRLQTKHGEALGERGNDYIQRMRDSAGRMQKLINDLLAFSRVTSKAKPFQPIDLNIIMQEIISDLEIRIEKTGGKVEVENLPTVDADPVQMRQLFQNLVGNALKFHRSGEKPIIKISAEIFPDLKDTLFENEKYCDIAGLGKGACQISIKDNGIGFEEKYLDRIFTVFQRLHGRSKYEGSGIGLAVCRKIVERHNGEVHAESVLNEGSTFFVTLPLKQSNKEQQNESK